MIKARASCLPHSLVFLQNILESQCNGGLNEVAKRFEFKKDWRCNHMEPKEHIYVRKFHSVMRLLRSRVKPELVPFRFR
jgi:hypothetical protein